MQQPLNPDAKGMSSGAKFGLGCGGLVALGLALVCGAMAFSSDPATRYAGIGFFALVVAIVAGICIFKMRGQRRLVSAIVTGVAAVTFIGCMIASPTPPHHEAAAEATAEPEAQATEEASPVADLTPGMVAGNPTKYEGDRVIFRCTISDVIDKETANATCGKSTDEIMADAQNVKISDDPDKYASDLAQHEKRMEKEMADSGDLVIHGSGIGGLDAKNVIVVDGHVAVFDGTNNFGASRSFPSIQADSFTLSTK